MHIKYIRIMPRIHKHVPIEEITQSYDQAVYKKRWNMLKHLAWLLWWTKPCNLHFLLWSERMFILELETKLLFCSMYRDKKSTSYTLKKTGYERDEKRENDSQMLMWPKIMGFSHTKDTPSK